MYGYNLLAANIDFQPLINLFSAEKVQFVNFVNISFSFFSSCELFALIDN